MFKLNALIAGSTGYIGIQLIRLLVKHKNINIKFDDLPLWFKSKTDSLTIASKKLFLNNFYKEPSLHIVFKNKEKLKNLTSEAFEKDIFGAPTFVVNNKIFWGQDRLDYALDEYNS